MNRLPGLAFAVVTLIGCSSSPSSSKPINQGACPSLSTVMLNVEANEAGACTGAVQPGDTITVDVSNGTVTDGSRKWTGCNATLDSAGSGTDNACELTCYDGQTAVLDIAIALDASAGASNVSVAGSGCLYDVTVH